MCPSFPDDQGLVLQHLEHAGVLLVGSHLGDLVEQLLQPLPLPGDLGFPRLHFLDRLRLHPSKLRKCPRCVPVMTRRSPSATDRMFFLCSVLRIVEKLKAIARREINLSAIFGCVGEAESVIKPSLRLVLRSRPTGDGTGVLCPQRQFPPGTGRHSCIIARSVIFLIRAVDTSECRGPVEVPR